MSLTTGDLQAIRTIVREEVRPIVREEVRPIVREEVQAEVSAQLGSVHSHLENLGGRLEAVESDVKGIRYLLADSKTSEA